MPNRTRTSGIAMVLLLVGVAAASPPGRWATSRSASRPPIVRGETVRVALFAPHGEDDTFWPLVAGFMGAAAEQLGMDLDVYFAHESREEMRRQIRELCRKEPRVDAVVFQSFKGAGRSFLDIAETEQVPAFIINAGISESPSIEPRREPYRWWIGQMLPGDREAGETLARMLVERARRDPARLDAEGRVHVIALEGVVSDGASIERRAGLHAALDDDDTVVLHQVVAANWTRDSAQLRTRVLLERYPEVSVVWAANDPTALGAIDAIRARGLEPGRDVIVGGVDWTEEALAAIDSGDLAYSAGGHFMEGAWVMVLLHDYFAGVDFEVQSVTMKSAMPLIDDANLTDYRRLLDPERWPSLDFGKLSRVRNPQRTQWEFGPEVALELLRQSRAP